MRHPDHPDEQDHRAMEAEREAWRDRHPHPWARAARPVSPDPDDGEVDITSLIQWLTVAAILAAFVTALVVLG